MHKTTIPQSVIDQTIERRGELHPLTDFDPTTTAVLVVDMQRFFIDRVPSARTIVENINRLAAALRCAGGTIVWISMTVEDNDAETWSHFYRKLLSDEDANAHFDRLKRGSPDWQLWDELDVRSSDEFCEKRRFSALIQGSSDLEQRLRRLGTRTVLITGTVTNVCCESTARDAMMLDFESIMVADGCEAITDEAHIASLCNFQTVFGDVFTVDELLEIVNQHPRLKHARG